MNDTADPTNAICVNAMSYPNVTQSMSCNQSSFKSKSGKSKFLFIGPGAKGQGFKAMFKLDGSFAQAAKLAKKEPDRFQVGKKGGWVTTRFTSPNPLPTSIWKKWLQESYELSGN